MIAPTAAEQAQLATGQWIVDRHYHGPGLYDHTERVRPCSDFPPPADKPVPLKPRGVRVSKRLARKMGLL